jgi:hypothetical protein
VFVLRDVDLGVPVAEVAQQPFVDVLGAPASAFVGDGLDREDAVARRALGIGCRGDGERLDVAVMARQPGDVAAVPPEEEHVLDGDLRWVIRMPPNAGQGGAGVARSRRRGAVLARIEPYGPGEELRRQRVLEPVVEPIGVDVGHRRRRRGRGHHPYGRRQPSHQHQGDQPAPASRFHLHVTPPSLCQDGRSSEGATPRSALWKPHGAAIPSTFLLH